MYRNLIKTPTLNMSHEEWLNHRQKSIGGSDAPSIIGLNPWSSPYTVWADKLGKLPPKEDNEAMRQGRDLEFYVAERFTEKTGKKVRRENNILVNPDYPFAHANVDRMVVGEDAGLECKTTSALNMKNFKNGAFPDTYYVQCVHYMMVTGCKKWYLAVLVLNKDFMVFEIYRDEEEIEALAKSEEEFWKLVEAKTSPVADGATSTTSTISILYPESNDESVNLFAYEADLQQYMALSAQIKELEKMKDEMANKVKAFLGEAGNGESDGYKVSWTSSSRSTFDSKRFASDHKDIDLSEYYKSSTYRTFKVTEKRD
jgi:putative phage-type endonuclease